MIVSGTLRSIHSTQQPYSHHCHTRKRAAAEPPPRGNLLIRIRFPGLRSNPNQTPQIVSEDLFPQAPGGPQETYQWPIRSHLKKMTLRFQVVNYVTKSIKETLGLTEGSDSQSNFHRREELRGQRWDRSPERGQTLSLSQSQGRPVPPGTAAAAGAGPAGWRPPRELPRRHGVLPPRRQGHRKPPEGATANRRKQSVCPVWAPAALPCAP